MTIGLFLLDILMSIIAGVFALYLPGRLWIRLSRAHLSPLEHLLGSLAGGAAFLTLIYWLLFLLKAGWLLWPMVLILSALEIWLYYQTYKRAANLVLDPEAPPIEDIKQFWPLGLIALLAVILQGRFIFGSGWPGDNGMSFFAWHGVDAPWHIYNIVQLAGNKSLEMPGFAGETLKNYHAFSDLLLGAFHRLLPVNPWHLYFRIAPFFYSVMLTALTFLVAYTWKKDKAMAYLAAAMMVLVSNFGYFLALIFPDKQYSFWNSLFWVEPPLTHLINHATSSSYIFFLGGLWSFLKWHKTRYWGYLLILGLLWGILPGFKVYPGLLIFMTLLTTGIITGVVQKNMNNAKAWLAILPLQAMILLPALSSARQLIHFMPGYNLGTMLVAPDRMNLMTSQALKILYINQPLQVGLLMLGLMMIFIIGNLGPRIIAAWAMIKSIVSLKKSDQLILFTTVLFAGALAAGTCFIQTGVKGNTIQFFYYAIVLTTIIAAWQLWDWIKNLDKKWIITLVAIYLGFGVLGTFQAIKVINRHTTITPEVYAALNWLQEKIAQEKAVILRPLPENIQSDKGFNAWLYSLERGRMTSMESLRTDARQVVAQANGSTLNGRAKPHLQENAVTLERMDTAVVAALVHKNTYLEDLRQAGIMDFPVVERARQVNFFYNQANVVEAREFIEQENIKYVILYANETLPFAVEGVPLKPVFENKTLTIYKYIKPRGW